MKKTDTAGYSKRRWRATALAIVVGAAASALFGAESAKAQDQTTIGIDDSYPPYMFSSNGRPAGLYYDLISGVFERMDISVAIEPMAWTTAVERTDRAEIGLGGLYKNDARLKKYDYSDAILEEKLMVFVRSGTEFAFNGLEDLRGLVVGVNSGWSYGQAFDDARAEGMFTAEEAKSDTENLMKLRAGEIDAAIVDSLAARTIISRREDLKDSVVELTTPMATNKGYLAFHKDAGKQSLLEYFDYILSSMKDDGSFDSIFLLSVEENAIVQAD